MRMIRAWLALHHVRWLRWYVAYSIEQSEVLIEGADAPSLCSAYRAQLSAQKYSVVPMTRVKTLKSCLHISAGAVDVLQVQRLPESCIESQQSTFLICWRSMQT